MKKSTIITLVVSISLIFIGAFMFFCALYRVDFDFNKIDLNLTSDNLYTTETVEIDDSFDSIYIDEKSIDIIITPADDNKAILSCYDLEGINRDVFVKDGVLNIINNQDVTDELLNMSVSTQNTNLTLYLPKAEYKDASVVTASSNVTVHKDLTIENVDIKVTSGDVLLTSSVQNNLKVDATSGSICLKDIDCKQMFAFTTSGDIEINQAKVLNDITLESTSGDITLNYIFPCKNLMANLNSGDFYANELVAQEYMTVNSTSGNIELSAVESNDMKFETTSGDVYGELLSKKIFVTNSTSGTVDIDPLAYDDTGYCTVNTTSGDITFKVKE